jgi:hypothetical protein
MFKDVVAIYEKLCFFRYKQLGKVSITPVHDVRMRRSGWESGKAHLAVAVRVTFQFYVMKRILPIKMNRTVN